MKTILFFYFPINHSNPHGTSGSPVLNNQGQVVGALTGAVGNLIFTTKTNPLQNFIARNIGQNCETMNIKNCLEKEIENLNHLAKQNYAPAQKELGFTYYENQNYKTAFYWLLKAALQGDVFAQYNLGVMNLNGSGVPKNYEQAFYWFQKAALQGYAPAQLHLGNMYLLRKGVIQNDNLALFWYQKAALQGFTKAQKNLAFMHKNGRGTPQNDEQPVLRKRIRHSSGWAY